jgi:signal transduction histidine kinase
VIGRPANVETGDLEFLGAVMDITERKRAEEALSGMAGKLIEAQEQERARIARELHDDINQRLALLAVNLEGLKENLPSSASDLTQKLGKVSKEVKDLGIDVQALSHQLHSSKLEYLGLEAAAAGFCRELSHQQRVEIDFQCEGILNDLPQETSLCLFRVLQEALQNGIKHSASRHFRVRFNNGSGQVELMVRDLGIGFDPEEAMKGRGLGLTSIRERLKLVNGYLSIYSRPQAGTTILARVPLSPRMAPGAAGQISAIPVTKIA